MARLADERRLHRELTVDGLRGIPVPIDCIDEDLVLPYADVALTSGTVGNDPTHGRSTGAVGSCTYWNSHAQMIGRMTGRLGQTHTRLKQNRNAPGAMEARDRDLLSGHTGLVQRAQVADRPGWSKIGSCTRSCGN